MKLQEAVEILRDHFADQSYYDERIDTALEEVAAAARLADAIDRGLELYDIEISRPSPRSHFLRLWLGGKAKAEVEATGTLVGLLERTLDRVTHYPEGKER